MKHAFLLVVALLASAAPAAAQTPDRIEVSAVVRSDRVSFEGGEHARLPTTGISAAYRIWRHVGVEGEVTMAGGESTRSYEGDFITYAGEGATREEILDRAVIARRTTVNDPGLGVSGGITVHTSSAGRVNAAFHAGLSFRQYQYAQTTTVVRVPEGVRFEEAASAFVDSRGRRGRGGLLFGLTVPVRITSRLEVAPELRLVWGGPARVGNNYDEVSTGARLIWKF
jgi:hypothetical protein